MEALFKMTNTNMTGMSLAAQVGGHGGVMSDSTGGLIMKPALPREIAFYQLLSSTSAPSSPVSPNISLTAEQLMAKYSRMTQTQLLSQLKRFLPRFYGTLKLEGQIDQTKGRQSPFLESTETPESVVLQNLSNSFTSPCILDLKLGSILYDRDATEEKRLKMEKAAKRGTSFDTGIRMTGFQNWDATKGKMISTPKSYGYALKVETLPEGFKRFFGLPGEIEELPVPSEEEQKEGEKKVEEIVPPAAVPAGQEITPEVVQKYKRSLIRILRSLHAGITEFETLMRFLEIRFVGASLLIVYEGDPSSLERAWNVVDQEGGTRGDGLDDLTTLQMGDDDDSDEEGMEFVPPSGGRESGRGFFGGMIGGFGAERKDGSSGFGLLDRTPSPPPRKKRRAVGSDETDGRINAYETHEPNHKLNDDHDDDEDEEDDDDEDSRARPFVFRLIDFAHTRLVQGEGRDESVLKGLETTLRLIQGRIDELTEDDGTQ